MQAVQHKEINIPNVETMLGDNVTTVQDNIEKLLENKIADVISAIEKTEGLTIDGVLEDGSIKVINENLKEAFSVSIDAIVFTPVKDLIEALKSNVFFRVYSITRIVGYYSRIHNWNSSKRAELTDRTKGNYWTSVRKLSEDTKRAINAR